MTPSNKDLWIDKSFRNFPKFKGFRESFNPVFIVPFDFNLYSKDYAHLNIVDLDMCLTRLCDNSSKPVYYVRRNVRLVKTKRSHNITINSNNNDYYTMVQTDQGLTMHTIIYYVPTNIEYQDDDLGPYIVRGGSGEIFNERWSYSKKPLMVLPHPDFSLEDIAQPLYYDPYGFERYCNRDHQEFYEQEYGDYCYHQKKNLGCPQYLLGPEPDSLSDES